MKRQTAIGILSFLLVIGCNLPGNCQEDLLLDQYQSALDYYSSGRVDSTLQILLSCIEDKEGFNSLSKSDRRAFYRLASQSAFYLEEDALGERFTRDLLSISPFYTAKGEDHPLFSANINRTKVIPKHQVGIRIGLSSHRRETLRSFSSSNYDINDAYVLDFFSYYHEDYYDYHSPERFPTVGLQYEYNLSHVLTIGTEIIIGNRIHAFLYPDMFKTFEYSFDYNEYRVTLPYLEWPLYAYYSFFPEWMVNPYLEAGVMFRKYFNTDSYTFDRLRSDNYGPYLVYEEYNYYSDGNILPALFFTNSMNISMLSGAGIRVRFKWCNLKANFRYLPSPFNSDPFGDLANMGAFPESEPLHYMDEIFLLKVRNQFQYSISWNVNLNYKAY